jgi:hypothetical protein
MKKSTTPTFLLELPLSVDTGQANRLSAHFEAARCLYNALLGEAMKRLRAMRADPAWQEARAIPQTRNAERKEAFSRLRQAYGFSEYALINFAKDANCAWIADHIDAVMAQTLATRAYRAANRVCLGQAKKACAIPSSTRGSCGARPPVRRRGEQTERATAITCSWP